MARRRHASRCSGLTQLGLLAGAAGLLASSVGWAQPRAYAQPPPQRPGESSEAAAGPLFRSVLGVEQAEQLLQSPELEDRLRGVEQLGTIGSPEAIELLVGALSPGHVVRVDARSRLQGVRALSSHLDSAEARSILASVLRAGHGEAGTPLDDLVRDTAAMALARSGDREALAPLLGVLASSDRAGSRARQAIVAYPPADLRSLVGKLDDEQAERKTEQGKHRRPDKRPKPKRKPKYLSGQLIRLLGELGDQRAVTLLRRHLKHKSIAVQGEAALALARLGDGSCEAKARQWLSAPKLPASLRSLGAEILVQLGVKGTDRAIAFLLSKSVVRNKGLELALRAPSPALAGPLRKIAEDPHTDPGTRQRAIAALIRGGGPEATRALIALLGQPASATQAALGLARLPDAAAHRALGLGLRSAAAGPARRLVLRAATVRYFERHETVAGLEDALTRAFQSPDPADRAVGAFGLALLEVLPIEELLASKDPVVVAAAARAALGLGADTLRHCPLAPQSPSSVACGAALLVPEGPHLSSAVLAQWAERGGALSPVAATALGTRDTPSYRPLLRRLLGGTEPSVRAAVALGLGASAEPSSVSLLVEAYRFETEPLVRRAVVRALADRSEPQRLSTLQLARDLDPDPEVRALARSALRNKRLGVSPPPSGQDVLWLVLQPNQPAEHARAANRAVLVIRPDGSALPVVAAPDGVVLVPGLARTGALSVQLAPAAVSGDASDR